MSDNIHGIVAGLQTTFPVAMLMSGLLSIAFFCVLELFIWIFSTFERRRGLYFWSLIVATSGIALNGLGYVLKFFQVTTVDMFSVTLIIIGWTCMVTGQSFVLYSRLHLVSSNDKLLRSVLALIVTNALAIHIPVTALVYGVNSTKPERFVRPYAAFEKAQLIVFALQEALVSGLYIYYAQDILQTLQEVRKRPQKAVMKQLIYINTILIFLDSILIALQFAGFYEVQTSLKPAIYGMKLKLEFNVLNHLLQVTRQRSQENVFCWSEQEEALQPLDALNSRSPR